MRLPGRELLFLVAVADARCGGFGLGGEEWEYVEYLADVAAGNPLPRDAKDVLFGFLQALERDGHVEAAAAACPREVFTLMAQSLTHLERQRGEAAALAAAARARPLGRAAGEDPEAQLAWAAALEHLGRGGAGAASCASPGAPRVYVYDTGQFASRPLQCSAGMEGVEVLIHRFLLASPCRTNDPAGADYYFVPFYSFCYQNEHLTPGNETAELDALNRELVASLDFFKGAAEDRHVFLFPHEFWDFPSWRSIVGGSHLMVVEANPLEWVPIGLPSGGVPRHCLDCFSTAKDVVLPGHTDYWTTRQLVALQKPWADRRYLVCYHGAFTHPLYDDARSTSPFDTTAGMTRSALLSLRDAGLDRVSIGGHLRPVRSYYERITDCQFCFVPKGVGFTNGRLMETFFSGCVPVILSDAMVVPFDQLLQWPSFSLKLKMPRTRNEALGIVDYLAGLPAELGLQMHDALTEHRCWFDYGPENQGNCSPYEGVLRVMALQRRAKQPRRFWQPAW